MNYLAHLLLAEKSPESQLGNLLGDFVKGNLQKYETCYNPAIIKGIKTHRKVDNFTDTHTIYIQSKRRISSINKRFSGIIIDICYDHFLANHWSVFSNENLEGFIAHIYKLLQENQEILPMRLQQAIPRMIAENWLGSYKTLEGVGLTFPRIARRLKRENNLATGLDELINNYSEIESDFLSFFPELIGYVEKIRLVDGNLAESDR
jgi:acyl carrier protein phosphodiesterase